ncbi:hypothetical protein LXL04_008023 [Taraxacum kok-saghyz]
MTVYPSPSWCDNLQATTGVEIPKFVDKTTPEYKPKFDALMVELKEAEQKSLKESERLEKEIADVQDLKESKRYRMSEWSSKEVIVAIHGNVDIVKVECDENLPPPPPPQRNSKEFVFGPFRPVGASGCKKLKPGEDWDNLTDTHRP